MNNVLCMDNLKNYSSVVECQNLLLKQTIFTVKLNESLTLYHSIWLLTSLCLDVHQNWRSAGTLSNAPSQGIWDGTQHACTAVHQFCHLVYRCASKARLSDTTQCDILMVLGSAGVGKHSAPSREWAIITLKSWSMQLLPPIPAWEVNLNF